MLELDAISVPQRCRQCFWGRQASFFLCDDDVESKDPPLVAAVGGYSE